MSNGKVVEEGFSGGAVDVEAWGTSKDIALIRCPSRTASDGKRLLTSLQVTLGMNKPVIKEI